MGTFLITGPTGFLGYHVIKALNARGDRPRVLISPADTDSQSPASQSLEMLDVEVVEGDVELLDSLRAACEGVDQVFHLKFTISMSAGDEVEKSLYQGNVVGTRNLLEAAAQAGVSRVVVSSSSLAVGLNSDPEPLNEGADWDRHAFNLPYALSRREAEQEALGRSPAEPPEIVVVNPSFTLGPEDYVGAPANSLVMKMSKPEFRLRAPIGFGVLDVRDYAHGVLLAADRGTPGQRYILSGTNLDSDELLKQIAGVVGFKPARRLITLRSWAIKPIVGLMNVWNQIKGKPAKVSPKLLELWGRHAWYDTSRACDELGWEPRELRETLRDTINWKRENPSE